MTDPTASLRRLEAFWRRSPLLYEDPGSCLARAVTVPALTGQTSLARREGDALSGEPVRMLTEGDAVRAGQLDYTAMAQSQEAATLRSLGVNASSWATPFVGGLGLPDLAWSQAALGCEVTVNGGATWAHPFATNCAAAAARWETALPVWEAELSRAAVAYAHVAAGRGPVAGPVMRGPLDMAASALGETRMCLAAADEPEELTRLLERCAEVFLRMSLAWHASAPAWHGGWMPYAKWGLWAPGPVVARMQNDAAVLLSPRFYQRYVTPLDEQIAQQFEYSIFHMHSGTIHALPGVLANRWLSVVQIQIDPCPSGPSPGQLMTAFAEVQAAGKGLLIAGPLTTRDIAQLIEALSPVGLCIQAEEIVGERRIVAKGLYIRPGSAAKKGGRY